MTVYKCFNCEKIIKSEYVKKKIRCHFCGYKIIYKPRTVISKVKAV